MLDQNGAPATAVDDVKNQQLGGKPNVPMQTPIAAEAEKQQQEATFPEHAAVAESILL